MSRGNRKPARRGKGPTRTTAVRARSAAQRALRSPLLDQLIVWLLRVEYAMRNRNREVLSGVHARAQETGLVFELWSLWRLLHADEIEYVGSDGENVSDLMRYADAGAIEWVVEHEPPTHPHDRLRIMKVLTARDYPAGWITHPDTIERTRRRAYSILHACGDDGATWNRTHAEATATGRWLSAHALPQVCGVTTVGVG